MAGVELEESTEEEKKAVKEKVDIHNLFTKKQEIYHKNEFMILFLWGITRETAIKSGRQTRGI